MDREDAKEAFDKIIILLCSFIIVAAVVFFSIYRISIPKSTKFECTGQLSGNFEIPTNTVYINVIEYKWWVKPVKASDGQLSLEIINQPVVLYHKIKKAGINLYIYRNNRLSGSLLLINKNLNLNINNLDYFEGVCAPVKAD